MYIIIDKKTYKLKPFNVERRQLFVSNILSNYNGSSFDSQITSIQEEIKKVYGVQISKEKASKDFFKEFDKLIYTTVWCFLLDEDKKEIGIIENLKIEQEEKIKFIEHYSKKVKELTSLAESGGEKVDQLTIHTFIAKHLGRSVEEVAEMDEIMVIKIIKEIADFLQQERIDNINSNALAVAYANGNKSAKTQINKLQSEIKRNKSYKKYKNARPEQMKPTTNFSLDELRRLSNG
jgi:hypothetical protein